MNPPRFQFSLSRMIVLVAAVAVNLWLFRINTFLGLFGLMMSKHVLIAVLCQSTGVDQKRKPRPEAPPISGEALHSGNAEPPMMLREEIAGPSIAAL